MKAIQIKYMSMTNTKGSRLKVWSEGVKPVTYSVESFDSNSIKSIELQAALNFANSLDWLQGGKLDLAIGQLPNLDHCAILVSKGGL